MYKRQVLRAVFFRTPAGREPVRDWLLDLDIEDRKIIGEDVKLVQFRWPLGMPLVRKLCLLYTSPSPRDRTRYRMPSSA